ncbi:addiction module protein [Turneriella parva]|uniref:Addiction module component, TIGR02574 family n=1 Tax=Turneriella parva (strain ATCC BAA-1111 / DSM 21527 / NCTC 11395 / H) TaxID=869212 RepID=I4B399_TURPD|nr:addiction module protein [Turneriella parva]AFM11756.1 addiction module component, TIGR02574 family [Turneriella parva DSM 21527]
MQTEQAIADVLRLAPSERAKVIEILQESLDVSDAAIDEAWRKEATNRLAAYRAGKVRSVPAEQVFARYT